MLKVSVITVTFNSGDYLEDAIKSVLQQDYGNIEYILIDGGSNDGTLDIVRRYSDSIDYWLSEPDEGIYDAMNKGLQKSTGEIVCFLNSDDFYSNQSTLSEIVRIFTENPDIDIVLGGVDFVLPSDLNRRVRIFSAIGFEPWKLRFGFMPPHPSSFVLRSTYKEVGLYRKNYSIAADFEWFCRAFLIYKLRYLKINKVFVRMREGGISTAGAMSYYISSKEQVKALKENGIYSNMLFIFLRLPIKFMQKLFINKSS